MKTLWVRRRSRNNIIVSVWRIFSSSGFVILWASNIIISYIRNRKIQVRFWFGLMLNVPVNNFSVMLGRSHRFLDINSTFFFFFFGGGGICFAQGHNTATRVGLEPPTSGSRVRGVNHQAKRAPAKVRKDISCTPDREIRFFTLGKKFVILPK